MNNRYIRAGLCLFLCALALCIPTAWAADTSDAAPPQEDVLQYFREIVFDAEYGTWDGFGLHRWETPIRVKVYGSPTDADLETLDRHIRDLNQVDGMPEINRVMLSANVEIYFVPLDQMRHVLSDYVEGNWGMFWCWYNADQQLTHAEIGIVTDVTNQRQRNHLILEEFTQALGMMQDSNRYADSIFYSKWTEVQQLSALDWQIVQLTYSPLLDAGMSEEKAIQILANQ